jgi:hypothetical protein
MPVNHEVHIANNGALPPATWARITTNRIAGLIEIGENPQAMIQKAVFEATILGITLNHHTAVQSSERQKLQDIGFDRLIEPFEPFDEIEAALVEVVAATVGTLFEAHFANPEVQDVVRVMLGSDFATQMDIERGWYASSDRSNPIAAEYFARKGQ